MICLLVTESKVDSRCGYLYLFIGAFPVYFFCFVFFNWYFIYSYVATLMSKCFLVAICCTLFVIPALTHMTFKLLSAGWHLIKIWDLHLSGGGCCLCLYAEFVLIFYSSAGTQRVQQMFPSVPVLRGAAV